MTLTKPSDGDPFYRLGDRVEPRMSEVLSLWGEPWLLPWREKLARQAAFASHHLWRGKLVEGDDKGAHKIVRDATVEDTTKRDLGTAVHGACENWLRGNPEGTVEPNDVQPYVQQFALWWLSPPVSRRRLLHVEATIFGDGWAGTTDLIYEEDGQTVLADIKTGRTGGAKQAMQIVGYGSGEFIVNPDGSTSPMPRIDRYVILDLKADTCRELVLSPTAVSVARAGFRGLVALSRLLSHKPLWN